MTRSFSFVLLGTLIALLAGGHGKDAHAGQGPRGLVFRMTETDRAPEAVPPTPTPDPLTPEETARVLARLPDLPADTGTGEGTVMHAPTRPPPRSGVTRRAPFPPAEQRTRPDTAAAGPLAVVNVRPEGEVDRGVQVAVSFSQPMVPVSGRAEIAARDLPVRMTPQPPGRWRWIGTRTLVFQPEPSLPMATSFVLEIPEGTSSMSGGKLPGTVRRTFVTGRPVVTGLFPSSYPAMKRHPTFVALFDQDVDADSVVAHVTVRARDSIFTVRRATTQETEKLAQPYFTAAVDSGRGVAFRTVGRLPGNAKVDIRFGEGIPSAEGPLRTDTVQHRERRTFGPLRVVGHWCGRDRKICNPGQSWDIRFSNPLDAVAIADSLVHVEPAIDRTTARAWGSYLVVSGASRPRTVYRVILDPRIRDTFGQSLGAPDTLTFDVGPARVSLGAAGGSFVVLDPKGPVTHVVRTVNVCSLRVRLYRVAPSDWPAFRRRERNLPQRHRVDTQPPGTLVLDRIIAVRGDPDVSAETSVDLTPVLPDGRGQAVLVVEAASPARARSLRPVHTWIQGTHIGLSAFADHQTVIAWATDLKTGKPMRDVAVRVLPDDRGGRTDSVGLARIPLRRRSGGVRFVVARRNGDVALLPLTVARPDSAIGTLRWHVLTDRPLYRPEEEVHAKGWVRLEDDGALPDLALPGNTVQEIDWRAEDRMGEELAKGRARVSPSGGFDLAFTVPASARTGRTVIELTALAPAEWAGRTQRHTVRVEEFRRPEFEVDLTKDADEAVVGGGAEVRLAARYFAGGALPGASVYWTARARRGWYRPPHRDGFQFGALWSEPQHVAPDTLTTRADGGGRDAVHLDFDAADPAVPMRLQVSATVTDLNHQAWTESTEILVHPSKVYVGLRTERRFVRRGEPLTVQAIAVDRDGKAVAGRPLELSAVRRQWTLVDGEWRQRELDAQHCRRVSAEQAVRCAFGPKPSGMYIVRAKTTDAAGHPTFTELPVWVGGGAWFQGPAADTAGRVQLVADHESYQPGDTAEILVQSPFQSAEGVWTLDGTGIARAQGFRIDGPSRVLRLPITEAHVPNVRLRVNLIGTGNDAGDVASGTLRLSVPPLSRTLAVRATPRRARIRPGDTTRVDVEVRDAHGRPAAGAEVALVVVDEAVWALAGDSVADPVRSFYPPRRAVTRERDLRSSVLSRGIRGKGVSGAVFDDATGLPLAGVQVSLEGPGGTAAGAVTSSDGRYALTPPRAGRYTVVAQLIGYRVTRREVSLDGRKGVSVDFALTAQRLSLDEVVVTAAPSMRIRGMSEPVVLRADFNALAAFVPTVTVDDDGHATVPIQVPDNLTRYRVIAVAAYRAKAFGKGESSLTVGLPIMARPSPPRFLRRGDRFVLPVVVQNTLDSAVTAEVAVRGTNLEWTGPRGFRVTVPPKGRAEVRFPASTKRAGSAVLQAAAVAGPESDAAQRTLPVWTPVTLEAFATYGQVEQGAAAVPIEAPHDVLPDVGGLEVTTSSTALSELSDAFLYLWSYPYECAEQISSRVLATVALHDALAAFHAAGLPDPRTIRDSVQQDVRRLERLQNADGGFSFWGPGHRSWPFVSAHVARALARARAAGYAVNPEVLERARHYLGRMEEAVNGTWPRYAYEDVLAYMLNVRALLGDPDPAGAARVLGYRPIRDAPLEALAWMLPVLEQDPARADLVRAIHRQILDRVTETAASAHFITGYDEGDYLTLRSSRRTDAVVLDALLRYDPHNPLNPKLVRGLLDHRIRGRWDNTQENVFVLLALGRYFDTLERTRPDFTARVWLGQQFAGEGAFHGHSADRLAVNVPMTWLANGQPRRNLVIQKDGTGRLYYRVGMRYAPARLDTPPADEGFAVERTYEPVDDSADVVHEHDGSWTIRAGARVRVRVRFAADGRRTHVALVDPLPAGLEPLNPDLRGSGEDLPRRPVYLFAGWWSPWPEHQSLRDDRAEAFTSLLYGGAYTYTYMARATTRGEYIAPPPHVEEMYHPETFGRGRADRVSVR